MSNNTTKLILIYALIDPRTKEVRYIGKTIRTLDFRLRAHINSANSKRRNLRVNWLKSLCRNGFIPEIQLLEACDESTWEDRERYWIKYGRDMGWNLVNSTDGGGGPKGMRHSEETKRKMSLAHMGNKSTTGRKHSEIDRARMRESHKNRLPYSTGTREKLSRAKQGKNNKLYEKDVRDIRKRLLSGETQLSISQDYNVGEATISNINTRKVWRWVEDE